MAEAEWANDLAGRTRAELHEPLEKQLGPLGRRAISALSPKPGERILDLGCGSGQTSVDLAAIVGPEGRVLGIDLSAPVLEVAQIKAANSANVHFVHADAQLFAFEPGTYDAAYSRFGVMFFTDPFAAFVNIRRALKRAGRLAFVCWRSLAENELDLVPLEAAWPHLPVQSSAPDSAPPFSFAQPARVHEILVAAGFKNIQFTAHDEDVGSGDAASMLELSLRMGSLGSILRAAPELRALVAEPVSKALAAHYGPKGAMLKAAIWIVTAIAATRD